MISQTMPRKAISLILTVFFVIMILFSLPVSADGSGDGDDTPVPGKIPVPIWWIDHMVGISITFQQ